MSLFFLIESYSKMENRKQNLRDLFPVNGISALFNG